MQSGDRVDVSGGCEAAVTMVTVRARLGWAKFRECGELLNSEKVLAEGKMIGLSELCKIGYMSHRSGKWCLSENEMAILRRTEREMMRASAIMCGVKLMDKKRTDYLMEMFGLEESVVQMAKANAVRWYGQMMGMCQKGVGV